MKNSMKVGLVLSLSLVSVAAWGQASLNHSTEQPLLGLPPRLDPSSLGSACGQDVSASVSTLFRAVRALDAGWTRMPARNTGGRIECTATFAAGYARTLSGTPSETAVYTPRQAQDIFTAGNGVLGCMLQRIAVGNGGPALDSIQAQYTAIHDSLIQIRGALVLSPGSCRLQPNSTQQPASESSSGATH